MQENLTLQARSTYRALLRELPRKHLATPSPLHLRLRQLFRSQEHAPSTTTASPPPSKTSASTSSTTPAQPFSIPVDGEERALRIAEAEQLAQYARAQRTYAGLLERYNPGMNLEEQERIRLTARRVGLNLPKLHDPDAESAGSG